jgi:hypothetical protein
MKSNLKKIPVTVAFLAVSFSLATCHHKKSITLEGSYEGVSESEWSVILTLKPGGIAEIANESWEPGEYKNRYVEKTEGRWSAQGNIVTLTYNGLTDTLVYDENLSLAILGYKGGAPGLKQTRTVDERSLLGNEPLWKLPHKFGETS